jgi:hypothetical protein
LGQTEINNPNTIPFMEIGDRFKLNQTEAALTTLVAITGSIHVAVGLNTGYQMLALARGTHPSRF